MAQRQNVVRHVGSAGSPQAAPLDLLTPRRAAALAGVSALSIEHARKQGALRAHWEGSRVAYDSADVVAWAKRRGLIRT